MVKGPQRPVSEDGLYLKAKLLGVDVNCLIDTGATRSIVHPRKYYSISSNKRPPLMELNKAVVLANGEALQPQGQVELPLQTKAGLIFQNFIVLETNEPLILGNDFLSSNRCLVDVACHTLHIGTEGIQCTLESKINSLFRLKLAEDISVPANSEMIIPGYVPQVEQISLPKNVMIETSDSCLSKGIVMALVDPSHGFVPVRVMNPSETSVMLQKDSFLGYCSQIEMVSNDTAGEKLTVGKDVVLEADLPEHLEVVFQEGVRSLDDNQQKELKLLLSSYKDLFAKDKTDRGKTHLVQHSIDTGGHKPIKQRPRRLPISKREEEHKEVQKMLEAGVIESSSSPWASPVVLVTKKDGSIRYCIDYRQLNDITLKDSYPLPHPQDCLEALRESKWFSTLDLQSGYWQIEMDPKDREKTAFASMSGLFQFKVMPFGLTNAPSTFERLMDKVFKGLNPEICLIYLDDIIVKGATFEQHIENLGNVFERLFQAGLKLSPKKCHLCSQKVSFLGHIVSQEGISTHPMKTEAVAHSDGS